MGFLPREKWARILVSCGYIVLGIAAVYLFFSKALAIILPFLLAWLIGWSLQSPIECLYRRLRIPRRAIGFILTLIVILFFGFIIILLANQLLYEAQRLFEGLSDNSENLLLSVTGLFEKLGERFPFIYEYIDESFLVGTVTEVLKNIITTLSTQIASFLAGVIRFFPGMGLFCIVFVIASFYFSADFKRINEAVLNIMPQGIRNKLKSSKGSVKGTGMKYIKAYSIILLITTAELFCGFIVLGVDYALTFAIVIAILDMLPVIGTGTVLVPWAIIDIITGNVRMGIGLIVLFGIISVIREIIEPKIVGECIGMHPLLTLAAMYTGYKLFGLGGIILLPPAVMFIKNAAEHKKESLSDNDITSGEKTC